MRVGISIFLPYDLCVWKVFKIFSRTWFENAIAFDMKQYCAMTIQFFPNK